jgi:hypothetical protein
LDYYRFQLDWVDAWKAYKVHFCRPREHAFASLIANPANALAQPRTLMNASSATDARCHAYICEQRQGQHSQHAGESNASAALHKANLGVDGVRVEGPSRRA